MFDTVCGVLKQFMALCIASTTLLLVDVNNEFTMEEHNTIPCSTITEFYLLLTSYNMHHLHVSHSSY